MTRYFLLSILIAQPALAVNNRDLVQPLVNVNRTLNAPRDMSCDCTMNGEKQVTFETPAQCGPDRLYLQKDILNFRKIDPKGFYTSSRPYAAGENTVPPKCVLYVMRTIFRDTARTADEKKQEDVAKGLPAEEIAKKTYSPDTSQFGSCAGPTADPQRIRQKACVTEDYFNLTYNSLADVSDCLNVPMNFTIPKFANESSFHVNTLGPVGDGGVGQFTESALKDVAVHYPEKRAQILKSNKPSCQRLRSIPGALVAKASDIKTADAERCHAMTIPPNPVRSLIYYGIFYHAAKTYSGNAWNAKDPKNPDDQELEGLLRQSGAKLDREKLKQMMFVMAYNAGPRPPVTAFKEWLRYRMAGKTKITAADFNFNFWPPKGFSAIHKQAEADVKEIAAKEKWSEEKTARAIQLERVKRRTAHLGAEKRVLSLPEYLYVYRNSIYISAVKVQATTLNRVFGEGVCAQKKFLEL